VSGHTGAQLLAIADESVRLMKRHRLESAVGFAQLLEAGLSNTNGNRQEAMKRLESAVHTFAAADMQLFREAARYCLGRLRSDGIGRDHAARADTWMRAQGIVQPEKLTASLAPGLL